MNVTIRSEAEHVDSLVAAYRLIKTGQRGIDAYSWFVGLLQTAEGASSVALVAESVSGVVTFVGDSAVLHSIQGDIETGGALITAARDHAGTMKLRGLALPGDRLTKNLFEEARLPAQMLLH